MPHSFSKFLHVSKTFVISGMIFVVSINSLFSDLGGAAAGSVPFEQENQLQ